MQEQSVEWSKVYTTSDRIEAGIVKSMLGDHDIPVVEMNKQDSAYVVIGEIDLMVPASCHEEALLLIKQSQQKK